MAKFLLVKFSVMAEITDADALREAALEKFDADDSTSDDYPDTADWHASKEGQQERRQVATQDVDALSQFVGFGLAEARRLLEVIDGVPGVKAVPLGSSVGPMEGTTQNEARYAWAERAKTAGYPERFAQEALGHNSKAVHRAYAKRALVKIPSLEDYEKRREKKETVSA